MRVKIVTDSTSDISPDLAKSLGIEIVPGYVRFGKETFRDGIDISKSGFYQKLASSPFHPVTSEATPKDFAEVYSRLADEAKSIVSVHISSKISRMYESATKGKKMVKSKCAVEVMDSGFVSIGLGLVVIAAARLANEGVNLEGIIHEIRKAVSQIKILGFFDTMKYIAKGGRASKHVMELSGIFQIKPLLTFKNGEIKVEGLVRKNSSGIDRLFEFVQIAPKIQDLGISYSTDIASAQALAQRLDSVFPEQKIYIEQIGAALGAHSGPDAVFIALRSGE
ncbi:DegV family protein [Chloroflexota bacterium]